VVDLLHEFELGVWKAIFTHLLRMLHSLEESKVHELDRRFASVRNFVTCSLMPFRYRQVPTFGQDTIRRFSKNASDMRRIAARDFEDLLQVGDFFLPFQPDLTLFSVCYPCL
jgi:hypothetical protein